MRGGGAHAVDKIRRGYALEARADAMHCHLRAFSLNLKLVGLDVVNHDRIVV